MSMKYVFDGELFQLAVDDAIDDNGASYVARQCGVDPMTVYNWRDGKNTPHVKNYAAFCSAFRYALTYFFRMSYPLTGDCADSES